MPASKIGLRPGSICSRKARSLADRGRSIRNSTAVPSSVGVRTYVVFTLGEPGIGICQLSVK